MATFNLNINELIYSLSDALDLVGVVQIHHGKRVGFMAAECGKQMNWTQSVLDTLFQAAILHDCGVSNTVTHKRLAQFEWEQAHDHCEVGANLLRSTPPLTHLAEIVLHHHTRWEELERLPIAEETRLIANCIFMVDRVDMLALNALVKNDNILTAMEEIVDTTISLRGSHFAPALTDAFARAAASEAFWLMLERERVDGYVSEWISHAATEPVDFQDVKSFVLVFSHIVDAKSPFTREHSEGVAALARFLGEQLSLSPETCDMLELTGLLHDIGKLRVPDEILQKPCRLTTEEFKTIQRHSFDTLNILKNVHGFEHIARWAGHHHERIDGNGYPFHLPKESLSLETRIISVADMFQALAQHRPYRAALPEYDILAILEQDVHTGHIDADVVEVVRKHLHQCWKAATLQQPA